jgi:3-dehydroquinate dehydratase-2
MRILIIHGPNLNQLGQRDTEFYGTKTLEEIDALLGDEARALGIDIDTFQSNSEGDLINLIQKEAPEAHGIIVNPGALTHYGLSLRDALADIGIPVIEVHLSNIYAREDFRRNSVIAPVAKGQISGLGWRSYVIALRAMADELREPS